MSTVLYALMLTVVLAAIVFGVLAGLGAWSLNRRNRLAPDLETGAPLQWLWSPTQPARLHRRLQRAVRPIHEPAQGRQRAAAAAARDHRIGPASSIEDVCRAITGQAIAVDREVVLVSRMPRKARRARMRLLQGEVVQIERLTVRVHHQRIEQARPATIGDEPRTRGEALTSIDHHLDALADAHAELHAIERAHGLDDPDRILGAIETREPLPSPTPPPAPAPARPTGPPMQATPPRQPAPARPPGPPRRSAPPRPPGPPRRGAPMPPPGAPTLPPR